MGKDIYQAITAGSSSVQETLHSLNLKNTPSVLDAVNRLEGAIFAWKHSVSDESSKRSPIRYPWYFMRDTTSEAEKLRIWIERAEALIQLLKIRFPNLPQTFVDVTKVQYNKVNSKSFNVNSVNMLKYSQYSFVCLGRWVFYH